jgi:hypothetical protein
VFLVYAPGPQTGSGKNKSPTAGHAAMGRKLFLQPQQTPTAAPLSSSALASRRLNTEIT